MTIFTSEQEAFIEHEVRLRTVESGLKDLRDDIKHLEMKLENKIDSHFKWMLSTMLLLIVTVITFMVTSIFV